MQAVKHSVVCESSFLMASSNRRITTTLWFVCFIATLTDGAPSTDTCDVENLKALKYLGDNERWLRNMNEELKQLNRLLSVESWQSMVGDSERQFVLWLSEARTKWRNAWCTRSKPRMPTMTPDQKRQIYLLCRGPKYTPHQARELTYVLDKLQQGYVRAEICRGPGLPCYRIEPDLERLMRNSRDTAELLWAWHEWRRIIGPPSRQLYPAIIALQNQGARNNGYNNIGEYWQEELETADLEHVVDSLFSEIRPFYKLLHAFVRHRLVQLYGEEHVSTSGPIPAHLLGNMWAQNWDSLLPELVTPHIDLDAALLAKNITVDEMALLAEEFYKSLGFEPMTDEFWKYSQIVEPTNGTDTSCHGTSANMFAPNDYRMLMCAEVSFEDFCVIHHEMGHIQYYMEYRNQPLIFQDGANSAVHEAIGDAIMLAASAPQRLEYLGLIPDASVADIEIPLLMRQALNKVPQLAFGLIVDKWRWGVMSGKILPRDYNSVWWKLRSIYQGVTPPTTRTDDDFDPASKFHVADNTPYIRYFLSGFLQMQFLETLCQVAAAEDNMPYDQLHRCNIYGAKKAGLKLRKMMSLGNSRTWQEALLYLTDGRVNDYSSGPFLRYFDPLIVWLKNELQLNHTPVGW